ncbi:MAG: cellulase family glycosylhydrolase [Roseiflexus sp.]|nr:cellulase family glycosylhydrolase [Roseiflexus sp.]MCS7289943.1 cellulase family glycosylhydrolase [Roseiflexus sp.]MDW8146883.1 cellulase family glycosylhydrolase [Roseiflexaceae bacterium]MDW8233368.1 cellulase family glycosylhydrolase [Roseiflexaceae bacterium]
MDSFTRFMIIAACAASLALSLLAACIATPAVVTTPLTEVSVPTAAVWDQAPFPVQVAPVSMPAFSYANVTPSPTLQPIPTPLPTPIPPTLQPLGPGGMPHPLRVRRLQFGVHAHLFWTDRATPLRLAKDAGFGWIRQQIHWKDQEGPPGFYAWGAELDTLIADVHARGLKLMISIVRSPRFHGRGGSDGLPEHPETLGNFVAALAQRYKGRIHAIQIWNEQNLAYENGGYVSTNDARHYVEILKVAYRRIKEVDPTIIVVSGAPASTAVDNPSVAISDIRYYSAMFAHENGVMRNYVDALGVHPGGSANPPETFWPDAPSPAQGWTDHPTFYFRNVERIRRLMEEYGLADIPVWITEFGWATRNNTPGFEFGNQVSYEQQAQYIVGAMRWTEERYPWVDAMFLWNLNFAPLRARNGEPWHEQASFSIINADYTPRPAYRAVQRYILEYNARRG